jgi:hypothetical protein
MRTVLDLIPKELNQTHNWMICPNGKVLLTRIGTIGRERGFFFVGIFNDKEEAVGHTGEKEPCFLKKEPGKLTWNKIDFELYDYGHTNFWAVIPEEELRKNTDDNGSVLTSAHGMGLPKFVAARCTTMDSAMQAIEEFCKYTGFKKGKVAVIHVVPSFDKDGKEVPQG